MSPGCKSIRDKIIAKQWQGRGALLGLLLILVFAGAFSAYAQEPQEDAPILETEALQAEIRQLRDSAIIAVKLAQDLEEELLASEASLQDLEEKERLHSETLAKGRVRLGFILSRLQRVALLPPASLVLAPEAPVMNARRALLLQTVIPSLEAELSDKRRVLEELAGTRRALEEERLEFSQRLSALSDQKQALGRLLSAREGLEERPSVPQELRGYAEDAQSIQDFVERLGEDVAALPPQEPVTLRPFPKERASLLSPVRGEVITLYGAKQDDNSDPFTKGITIKTFPGAQVIAPYDGRVVYTGPFRGYGLILIIEHEGRYHSLLAGLATIYVAIGQAVLAGEPVGEMGQDDGAGQDLYLELREDVKPINPLPWLGENTLRVRS